MDEDKVKRGRRAKQERYKESVRDKGKGEEEGKADLETERKAR